MPKTHSRSPSPTQESRKRGRIACVPCRQAKVRCDLTTAPCSRCSKMQLDCSVNPGFKRTNKRDKFNELEDNVQRLQSLVEKNQGQDSRYAKSATNTNGEDIASNVSPASSHRPSPPHSHSLPENTIPRPVNSVLTTKDTSSYTLGDVTISVVEIQQLFKIYFEKYHPILPILDPEKSHVQYYERSTMLFWSIVATALRTYQRDAALLTTLTPVLTIHLWSEIGSWVKVQIGGPTGGDLSEVQTLVLHATWPLPSLHLWSDRAMTMSSMALTSGMHMGLHRPGFDAEYAKEPPALDGKVITERSAAWVAAYCLCVNIAIENGHEALVPSRDWLFNNICSHAPTIYVEQELRQGAIVAKHANEAFKFFASMSDNPAAVAHDPSFFAHVALFEKTLLEVSRVYAESMSLPNKLRSLGSVLLVQSMYFLADQSLEQSKQAALRAYATAINLLNTLVTDDNTNDFLLHAPNMFLRIIVRAAFVILRVLFSSHGDNVDYVNAKTLYNTSVFFLRQMSVKSKEKDQPIRVAEALKVMWKHMESEPSFRRQPPVVRIRSRLGATLLYDCLIYYRRAAVAAQNNRPAVLQNNSTENVTPVSVTSNSESLGVDVVKLSDSDVFMTPSFDSFLESDLSWMDSLIDPIHFPAVT